MQDVTKIDPNEEARFEFLYRAECERKENLLTEFEKLEIKERRKKNLGKESGKKKYERLFKGFLFIEKTSGEHIHLIDQNAKKFGSLHVNAAIVRLLRKSDVLEGLFGFRKNHWRVQFLISITNSTEDFLE